MRRLPTPVLALCLLGTSCSELSAGCGSVMGSGGEMREGTYYVEEGAPDPLACETDDDCVAEGRLADDGCCSALGPTPQSRAWHEWKKARMRSEQCEDVECEAGDPDVRIGKAPDCAHEAVCERGRCVNACQ